MLPPKYLLAKNLWARVDGKLSVYTQLTATSDLVRTDRVGATFSRQVARPAGVAASSSDDVSVTLQTTAVG